MITVIVPVSPIKSHPSTEILDETIGSIRHHLPDAEIILTFDGVRPEQSERTADYEEFIRRALWKADHNWGHVAPWIFDEHSHQIGMLRGIIDKIHTPLLMYVEQDTPLVTDKQIDWDCIYSFFGDGHTNLVRFHHEAQIPSGHEHMMHGSEDPLPFMRTSQWSQRPHVASLAYYHRILDAHFSEHACCFIEDVMHGVAAEAFRVHGMPGWMQHRLHIYVPEDDMKRSYHTDGRAGEPKYDATQTW